MDPDAMQTEGAGLDLEPELPEPVDEEGATVAIAEPGDFADDESDDGGEIDLPEPDADADDEDEDEDEDVPELPDPDFDDGGADDDGGEEVPVLREPNEDSEEDDDEEVEIPEPGAMSIDEDGTAGEEDEDEEVQDEEYQFKSRVPQKYEPKKKSILEEDSGFVTDALPSPPDGPSPVPTGSSALVSAEDGRWVRRSSRQTNSNPKYNTAANFDFLDETESDVDDGTASDGVGSDPSSDDMDATDDDPIAAKRAKRKEAKRAGSKTTSSTAQTTSYVAVQQIETLLGRKRAPETPADGAGAAAAAATPGDSLYLVKWKGRSHVHCDWLPEPHVRSYANGALHLSRFAKKEAQGRVYVDVNDHYFNPDYSTVDRVIARARIRVDPELVPEKLNPAPEPGPDGKVELIQYLTKWQSLQYADSTWETEDVVDQADIDRFLETARAPGREAVRAAAKNKAVFRETRPRDYDNTTEPPPFKSGNQLRSYQLEGVNWLCYNWHKGRNSILADEMGLGKTVQTVGLFHYLHKIQHIRGPFLVVAPLSTIAHWRREVETWTDMYSVVYHGSQASRQMIRAREWDQFNVDPAADAKDFGTRRSGGFFRFHVLVTTYEMVNKDRDILSRIDWACMAVDEAHRLKNRSSALFKSLNGFKIHHCVLLTGTPIQNRITELGTLLHFLEPAKFADIDEFEQEFGEMDKKEQVDKLHAVLRPYLLRRMKVDVEKALPPREETLVEVELTRVQKQYYKAIYEKNTDYLVSRTGSKPSLMNIGMQLRKCCNHPYLLDGAEEANNAEMEAELNRKKNEVAVEGAGAEGSAPSPESKKSERVKPTYSQVMDKMVRSCGKLVLVDKLLPRLKSQGHRVLVFSQMVRVLDILEDYLRFRQYSYTRLDGSMSSSKRQVSIDRFSREGSDIFVFLLCTRAGGVGINLTAADTVIIYDSDWNPQNDIQAQARCHRIGQTKDVKVYRLITKNTYEAEMFQRASLKLGLDKAVLHSMAEGAGGKATGARGRRKKGSSSLNPHSMDKKEVESLLKHGAYHVFLNSDEGKADSFCDQNLDQILERNARVVTMGDDAALKGNSTFSKASFVDERQSPEDDIKIDDPEFWTKLGLKKTPEPSLYLGVRQRRITKRYGMGDDAGDGIFSSDEGSDEYTDSDHSGRFAKKGGSASASRRPAEPPEAFVNWSRAERDCFLDAVLSYGPFRWDRVRSHRKHIKVSRRGRRSAASIARAEKAAREAMAEPSPLADRTDAELNEYLCGFVLLFLRVIATSSVPAVQHTVLTQLAYEARKIVKSRAAANGGAGAASPSPEPSPTNAAAKAFAETAEASGAKNVDAGAPAGQPDDEKNKSGGAASAPMNVVAEGNAAKNEPAGGKQPEIPKAQQEALRQLEKVGIDASVQSPIFVTRVAKKARSHLLTIERLWTLHQIMLSDVFVGASDAPTSAGWNQEGRWTMFVMPEKMKVKESKAGPTAEWWTRDDDCELVKAVYHLGLSDIQLAAMRDHERFGFRRHGAEPPTKRPTFAPAAPSTDGKKTRRTIKPESYTATGAKRWPNSSILNKRFIKLLTALTKRLRRAQKLNRKRQKLSIKQVKSAWMYFSKDVWNTVKAEHPGLGFSAIGKKVGERWQELDPEQKRPYEEKHRADLERYKEVSKKLMEEEAERITSGGLLPMRNSAVRRGRAAGRRGDKSQRKLPKRIKAARSALAFYSMKHRPAFKVQFPGVGIEAINEKLREKWEQLAEEDKTSFGKQAARDLERYTWQRAEFDRRRAAARAAAGLDPLPVGRSRRKRKRSVKSAKSAWMFFSGAMWARTKEANPDLDFSEVGKLVGNEWRSLSAEQKAPYKQKAEADAKRYKVELKASIQSGAAPHQGKRARAPHRRGRGRSGFRSKVKPARSAWMLFSKDAWAQIKADDNIVGSEMTRVVGERWRALTPDEKRPYQEAHQREVERFNREKAEEALALSQSGVLLQDDDGMAVGGSAGSMPRSRRRRRARSSVKPVRSAWIFFTKDKWPSVKADNPDAAFQDIGRKIGEMWKSLSAAEREPYLEKHRKDAVRYAEETRKEDEMRKAAGAVASAPVVDPADDSDNIPRFVPPGKPAYMFYSLAEFKKLPREAKGNAFGASNLKIITAWKALPEEDKTPFRALAEKDQERYREELKAAENEFQARVAKDKIAAGPVPAVESKEAVSSSAAAGDSKEASGNADQNTGAVATPTPPAQEAKDAEKTSGRVTPMSLVSDAAQASTEPAAGPVVEAQTKESPSKEASLSTAVATEPPQSATDEKNTPQAKAPAADAGAPSQAEKGDTALEPSPEADEPPVVGPQRKRARTGLRRVDIKKAKSAWMYFSKQMWDTVRLEMPDAAFGDIGKYLGETWRSLNPVEKEPYVSQHKQDKIRFKYEVDHSVEAQHGLVPRRRGAARVKAPKSAWSFYSKDMWLKLRPKHMDLSFTEMGRMIGQMWRELPAEEKAPYQEQHVADTKRFELETMRGQAQSGEVVRGAKGTGRRARRRGPKTAWQFFSKGNFKKVKEENKDKTFGELGRLLGMRWKALSTEGKAPYEALAREDALRFPERAKNKRKAPGAKRKRPCKATSSSPSQKSNDGKPKKRRKKKEPRVKNALSAWMFFNKEKWAEIRAKTPGVSFADVGKSVGEQWKALSPEAKEKYDVMHKADVERYRAECKARGIQPGRRRRAAEQKKTGREAVRVGGRVAVSAFKFFSREMRPKIAETQPALGADQIRRLLSERWKNLAPEGKTPFMERHRADVARLKREQAQGLLDGKADGEQDVKGSKAKPKAKTKAKAKTKSKALKQKDALPTGKSKTKQAKPEPTPNGSYAAPKLARQATTQPPALVSPRGAAADSGSGKVALKTATAVPSRSGPQGQTETLQPSTVTTALPLQQATVAAAAVPMQLTDPGVVTSMPSLYASSVSAQPKPPAGVQQRPEETQRTMLQQRHERYLQQLQLGEEMLSRERQTKLLLNQQQQGQQRQEQQRQEFQAMQRFEQERQEQQRQQQRRREEAQIFWQQRQQPQQQQPQQQQLRLMQQQQLSQYQRMGGNLQGLTALGSTDRRTSYPAASVAAAAIHAPVGPTAVPAPPAQRWSVPGQASHAPLQPMWRPNPAQEAATTRAQPTRAAPMDSVPRDGSSAATQGDRTDGLPVRQLGQSWQP